MRFIHDPDAWLDYHIDWGNWLIEGDSLVSATWTAPPGIIIEDSHLVGAVATIWVSGGVRGELYQLTCRVVTAAGRKDDRSIVLYCYER